VGAQDVTVPAIAGVIAAGQKWKLIWSGTGNNADGILGLDDGSMLVAQNDNSSVLKIDKNGKTSIAYMDTYTGGALTMNTKGVLFVAERALNPAIWQLKPQRKLLANTFKGDPLDCLGLVLNDITADSKGGVYFTMAGVYYASPQGMVIGKYGDGGNGIILSKDEKTLYVTGRLQRPPGALANNVGLVAWDVQPDGTLANPRQFAEVGNDGSTIDSEGRIYTTGPGGIFVVAPDGKTLGTIPTPRSVISVAFGGRGKKMLFSVSNNRITDEIYAIPMIAQGFKGRAK
jgi:gluconolactonase